MYYFLGLLLIMCFAGANMRYGKRELHSEGKQIYTTKSTALMLSFVFLVMLFSFESVHSNADMIAYRDAYIEIQSLDYDISSYIQNKKDPAFYLVCYLFAKMGLGFYWWHAFLGLLYSLAFYNLLKKYSPNIYISIIVFVTLGQLNFALSALRQMTAIIFIMLSFTYIEQKKPIKFIALTIVASLFHSTAIIFIIAYPLYRIRLKIKTIIFMVVAMLLTIPMAKPLFLFVMPKIGSPELYYNYLQSDLTLSISGAIISIFIFLFCVVVIFMSKGKADYQGLCNFALVSVFFQILSAVLFAEAFRFSLYFSIFDVLLIAEACSCGGKGDKSFIRIKTVAITAVLVVYYFVSPQVNIVDYIPLFL